MPERLTPSEQEVSDLLDDICPPLVVAALIWLYAQTDAAGVGYRLRPGQVPLPPMERVERPNGPATRRAREIPKRKVPVKRLPPKPKAKPSMVSEESAINSLPFSVQEAIRKRLDR